MSDREIDQPRVDFSDAGHNFAYMTALGFWRAYEGGEVPGCKHMRPGVATLMLEATLEPWVDSQEAAARVSCLALADVRQLNALQPSDFAAPKNA